MKKLILLGMALCMTVMTQALTVVSTAGGLSSAITTAGGSLSTVTDLSITGAIDARDFKMMRDSMPILSTIDFSGVNIASYTGTGGTSGKTSYTYAVNVFPLNAFYNSTTNHGKTTLTSITLSLSTSITTIGMNAFNGCSGLTSVTLPSTLTSIEKTAFNYCIGITSFTIPPSVTTIGEGAFLYCTGLTSITLPDSLSYMGNYVFQFCTGLKSVTIPPTVTDLGSYTFEDCSGLISIIIPPSIPYIGSWTFKGCSALTSINFTPTSSVAYIGECAFKNCIGLTSFTVPASVTLIGMNAFESSGLTSLNFSTPSSLTNLDRSAFVYCAGLTSIILPFSVKYVGPYAFYGCTGLTSFTIPSSVLDLGNYSFCNCSKLTSITIPSSVVCIRNYSFSGCSGLTSIYTYSTTPIDLTSFTSVFAIVNKTTCVLHVPVGCKASYQAATQWQDFTNIVEDLVASTKDVSASKVKVSIRNGQLIISNLPQAEQLTIYNLQGTAIYNQQATTETVTVNLPAHGVYVVSVGEESLKVVN